MQHHKRCLCLWVSRRCCRYLRSRCFSKCCGVSWTIEWRSFYMSPGRCFLDVSQGYIFLWRFDLFTSTSDLFLNWFWPQLQFPPKKRGNNTSHIHQPIQLWPKIHTTCGCVFFSFKLISIWNSSSWRRCFLASDSHPFRQKTNQDI